MKIWLKIIYFMFILIIATTMLSFTLSRMVTKETGRDDASVAKFSYELNVIKTDGAVVSLIENPDADLGFIFKGSTSTRMTPAYPIEDTDPLFHTVCETYELEFKNTGEVSVQFVYDILENKSNPEGFRFAIIDHDAITDDDYIESNDDDDDLINFPKIISENRIMNAIDTPVNIGGNKKYILVMWVDYWSIVAPGSPEGPEGMRQESRRKKNGDIPPVKREYLVDYDWSVVQVD